jgi:DNA polymerase-3 subunit delta'
VEANSLQSQIIGHEWAVEHLMAELANDRVHHAYLITGPRAVGKTTLALAFAEAVMCADARTPDEAVRCSKMVKARNHPDLAVLAPESESDRIKIDQVRDLQHALSLSPYMGGRRVCVLVDFDRATGSAADALLKTLEEPPPYAMLILTAGAAESLLETVVSRCRVLTLRTLPVDTVRDALIAQWGANPERAELLAALSGGRIGWAVNALENPEALEERADALDTLFELLPGNRAARFGWTEKAARDKDGALRMLEIWEGVWRDVLLLASGSGVPITNRDREAEIVRVAESAGTDATVGALRAVRDARQNLTYNVHARLTLDVLMLDLPHIKF